MTATMEIANANTKTTHSRLEKELYATNHITIDIKAGPFNI